MACQSCICGSLPFSVDTPPLILAPAQYAEVRDGRGRFREIYCAVREDHGAALPYDRPCEEVIWSLSNEPTGSGRPVWLGPARLKLRILVASGIYSECVNHISNVYSYALIHLEQYGYRSGDLRVSGRSSSTHNALQIRNALRGMDYLPDEKVVLVGYSKGISDILEAIVSYPEIQQRVAAVVSVAGTVGGTPLAEVIGEPYQELLKTIPVLDCPVGTGDPIESLKRTTRQQWLSQNRLPASVKYHSLAAFAQRADISAILQPTYDRLADIDPRNDSQVIFYDAIIPGSTLLGYIKADHWAVAMPFSQDLPPLLSAFVDKNKFPREVLLEAVIRFVEEDLQGPDW
jgi:pimeloyl-ACP methyl ester carboxylesterase